MNTTPPTAEQLATLMQSADTLRSVAEKASRAGELEKETIRLGKIVARQAKEINDCANAIGHCAYTDISGETIYADLVDQITRMRETLKTAQEGNRNYAATVARLQQDRSEFQKELKILEDHVEREHVAAWKRIRAVLPAKPLEKASSLVEDVLEHIEHLKQERDNWEDGANRHLRNAMGYYTLLQRTAEHLGQEVYVCDDGSRSVGPLVAKVPELVGKLVMEAANLRIQNGLLIHQNTTLGMSNVCLREALRVGQPEIES